MSIKSDKWITRQCTEPKHVTVGERDMTDLSVLRAREVDSFSYETSDKLAAELNALEAGGVRSSLGLRRYRNLTQQERDSFKPMISPFCQTQVRTKERPDHDPRNFENPISEKIISYGLSSYGYDIRAADEFKVFTNINSTIVDPKNFDPKSFVEVGGKGYCIIPPNSFALARTVEYFRIPRNVLTICLGKSTYARCGIVVNVTPFEPEWDGYV